MNSPNNSTASSLDPAAVNTGGFIDAQWLKALATECGADDVGLVETDRQELATEKEGFEALLPGSRTVISIAVRMNRDALSTPWMGIVNKEAGTANEAVDKVATQLSKRLLAVGIRNVAVHAAFPMDTHKWPGKMWPISHKTIGQQAGLGRIGLSRILIHPKYGAAFLLSAVVVDLPATHYDTPPQESPCHNCNLCVSACPTGSIQADGSFSFMNCATHNYRFRLGGFNDWAESLADSNNSSQYRQKVSDAESVSMWQSLAYKNNYTCLNCLAACPAGDKPALGTKKGGALKGKILAESLKNRGGPVYVLAGSDAETYAEANHPAERIRRVKGGTRPSSARSFLESLPLVFQPGQAAKMDATFHFDFTGADPCQGTVEINKGKLKVSRGFSGQPNLKVTADGPTWVSFLAGDAKLLPALLRRRILIKGPPTLLTAFAKCFPG